MLTYIKKPIFIYPIQDKISKKFLFLLKSFGYVFLFNIFAGILILSVDLIVIKHLHGTSIKNDASIIDKYYKLYGYWSILIVCFVAPLIEEIIFRLPLNLKPQHITIAFGLLFYKLIKPHIFQFNFTNIYDYSFILITVAVSLVIYITLKGEAGLRVLNIIKEKHFCLLFYFITTIFALLHILNFSPLQYRIIYVYPIYVLPQFIIGLFIGNIRMRYGFIWGLALHILVNLLPTTIFLIKH